MTKKSYVSCLPAKPHEASEPSTIRSSFESVDEVRHHIASTEAENRLRTLANMADEEIDLQEMPEVTQQELERAVRGYLPVVETQVNLWVDEEVKAWLSEENRAGNREINHILRREMQRLDRVKQRRNSPFALDLAKAS